MTVAFSTIILTPGTTSSLGRKYYVSFSKGEKSGQSLKAEHSILLRVQRRIVGREKFNNNCPLF